MQVCKCFPANWMALVIVICFDLLSLFTRVTVCIWPGCLITAGEMVDLQKYLHTDYHSCYHTEHQPAES